MELITTTVTDIFFSVGPTWRIILVFLSSFAEGLPIIGAILPGGTIALLVGSLSDTGFISPLTAIMVIAIGSFLGDSFGFFIGKYFKHVSWIKKMVSHEKHQTSWELFDRHIALIVIFGKLIPVVRSAPSFFAGARNASSKKYLLFSATGSLLWAFVGIYGGSALTRLFGPYAVPLILGILVASALVALIAKKRKNKNV
jgi:membrane protein DedA with SNARE-associated domain